MYVPTANAVDDVEDLRRMVAAAGAASFVTVGDDGYPRATLVPILWDGDRVVAHLARGNDHWRSVADGSPCLLVVAGVDTYVSPAWYPTKAEHGRVVPTWNYETVHLRGRARVHEDAQWLLDVVTRLTDRLESGRPDRWHVDDAPAAFVAGQLRGIVGLEVDVEEVVGKSKLSQNRSAADRAGVVEGLRAAGGHRNLAVADVMAAAQGSA